MKTFIRTTISYENSRERTPVHHENKNAPKREAVGICPRCSCGGRSYASFAYGGLQRLVLDSVINIFHNRKQRLIRKMLFGLCFYFLNSNIFRPVHHENKNAPKREAVGICPRCGKQIFVPRSLTADFKDLSSILLSIFFITDKRVLSVKCFFGCVFTSLTVIISDVKLPPSLYSGNPRTDSEYISEDMKPLIESIVKMLSESPVGNENGEHAKSLLNQGLP